MEEPVAIQQNNEAKLLEDLKLDEKKTKLEPQHTEFFKAIENGDFGSVQRLVTEANVSTNISDENDMSPLLQAAYRGHTDIVHLLLSNGADVNVTCHTNFYTPLMMAAISGKMETCRTLLEAGAKVSTTNSIGKKASDLASFVGQHEISSLIRNFLTFERLEPYCTPQGSNPARIAKSAAKCLQQMVMLANFHPVKVVISVMEQPCDVSSLKNCRNVLDDLGRKCVRDDKDFDEILALKCHEVSSILSLCCERLSKDKPDLTSLVKTLLKENEAGIQLGCEKVIRDSLMKFPFAKLPAFLQLIETLSNTKLGDEPTALSCMQSLFSGMQSMRDCDKWCATCWDGSAPLQCSACRKVRYCSQRCQKLHWFVHKKKCLK